MNSYDPISCTLHDYLEIACLYHYEVLIETVDEQECRGIAKTTETDDDKLEWLVLEDNQRIAMNRIDTLTALTDGAKFQTIKFSSTRESSSSD